MPIVDMYQILWNHPVLLSYPALAYLIVRVVNYRRDMKEVKANAREWPEYIHHEDPYHLYIKPEDY